MKRVRIFANSSWNILHFRRDLIDTLKKTYNVDILVPKSRDLKRIKGVSLSLLSYFNTEWKGLTKEVRSVKEISQKVSLLPVDLTLIFTVKSIVYYYLSGKHKGQKVIAVITGLGHSVIVKGWRQSLFLFILRRSLKKMNQIVVQNSDDLNWVIQNSGNESVQLIRGSGVDTTYFYPKNSQEIKYDFVFVGRCLLEKGMKEIMDAAKLLKQQGVNIRLAIVGKYIPHHPRFPHLQLWNEFISQPNINYLGEVEDTRTIVSQSKCVLLPSYREGLSRALLEAQSMALPCLTTDVPGCRDIVDDSTGWVVKPKNSLSLMEGMLTVMSSTDDDRLEMGRKARQRTIELHDTKVINIQYLDLIERNLND